VLTPTTEAQLAFEAQRLRSPQPTATLQASPRPSQGNPLLDPGFSDRGSHSALSSPPKPVPAPPIYSGPPAVPTAPAYRSTDDDEDDFELDQQQRSANRYMQQQMDWMMSLQRRANEASAAARAYRGGTSHEPAGSPGGDGCTYLNGRRYCEAIPGIPVRP
jgi:hypothetical protein